MHPRREIPLLNAPINMESGCALAVKQGSMEFDPEVLFSDKQNDPHQVYSNQFVSHKPYICMHTLYLYITEIWKVWEILWILQKVDTLALIFMLLESLLTW